MHSDVEKEEVILYPHVLEKIRRANLRYFSAHFPEGMAAPKD
jgi:hypothetical protein